MKFMQTSIKIDETNERSMRIFDVALKHDDFLVRVSEKFLRGHNVNINIHKRFPRAAGYKLQATGQRRQTASYRQQAAGEE